jgi:zinc protease
MKILAHEDGSPLLSVRVVFLAGSAMDARGREGAAWLAAQMLAHGGTRRRSYKQILDFLFPRGATIEVSADKEMTCFRMQCHADHARAMAELVGEMLCDPGWREEDFARLRDDAIHYLEAELRGENDEELGREALYGLLFSGHPYGHPCQGRISSLRNLGLDAVREFYTASYGQDNVILACGGAEAESAAALLRERLRSLPVRTRIRDSVAEAPTLDGPAMAFVEKPSQSVAVSLGFPIDVLRGHEDYPALLVAVSALGQHRMSSGRLFQSLRQHRGLNYGDYAYIEYFPAPMFTLEPEPNHARRRQIFELWIRPVAAEQAHFAVRLALYELEKLMEGGLSEEEFENARSFLLRHWVLLEEARSAQLGHEIDGLFYGTGLQSAYLRQHLPELTLADVRRAVERHLRPRAMAFAFAGAGMARLREAILSNAPSPIRYNSAKPDWILREDEAVAVRRIDADAGSARVVPAEEMFE